MPPNGHSVAAAAPNIFLLVDGEAIRANLGERCFKDVAPELSLGIFKAFHAGDYTKAVELHSRLIRLPSMYNLDTPFVNVVKEAMRLTGLDISTYCLPPAGPLAADKIARLANLLKQAGLVK